MITMANLNYSHYEDIGFGMVFDEYYCTNCNARYGFMRGEAPYMDQCEECDEKFDGIEYNDQIGG